MSNKIYELSDSDFIKMIKSSHNISEVLFKLHLTTKGNSWGYSLIKKRMKELEMSFGDFIGKSPISQANKAAEISPQKALVKNSPHPRCVIRKKIISKGLLEYKCQKCGISEWKGKPLSLELDHINGINDDNRIENLRFLCPNCHSQTKTYGSKNSRILSSYELNEEDKQIIEDNYKECNSIQKVCELTGYKREAVKQAVKELGLVTSNQKYVIRYDLNGKEIGRWGSINECCQYLIAGDELRTDNVKTARNTFLRNRSRDIWLNSKWEVIDAN